jgi:hypothetical protein
MFAPASQPQPLPHDLRQLAGQHPVQGDAVGRGHRLGLDADPLRVRPKP